MLARPRVLSLITTRRCTAECDHCCIGSSPRATQAIPVDRMHSLIDEAKRIPSIERVVFTGGECFLLGRDLDALIAHAHELNFQTRVITNGYWAINDRAARARVATLKIAGLDEMMLSTGMFHQRFVPIERILQAARAAAAALIPVRIAIEVCDQQSFDETILYDELTAEIRARRVFIGHDPWTTDAGGRGRATLTHDGLMRAGAHAPKTRCAQVLDTLTVTPDQNLLACCGFPMEQLPRMRIGSVASTALDQLVSDEPDELLRMALHTLGPNGIAEFLGKYIPDFALPPSASICQSCVALQRNDEAMAVIASNLPALAQSVVADYLYLQANVSPIRT